MALRHEILVLDFNRPWRFGRLLSTVKWKGEADARGEVDLCAVDGFPAEAGFQRVCESLSRQLSHAGVLLPRPIPRHGVRAVDLSREPAGHRDMPQRCAVEVVPRRLSWPGFQEHLERCQQAPRLAHLGRLRAGAHSSRPGLVRPGRFRRGAEARCLCPGLHDHRSVLGPVSLGAISSAQGSREAAHADRPAWQHPLFYPHNSRENARCHGPRPSSDRAGRLLHDGQRLHRFRSLACFHSATGVLRHACQEEPRLLSPRVPRGGQVHRASQRPDDRPSGAQDISTLSRSASSRGVLRRRARPATGLSAPTTSSFPP